VPAGEPTGALAAVTVLMREARGVAQTGGVLEHARPNLRDGSRVLVGEPGCAVQARRLLLASAPQQRRCQQDRRQAVRDAVHRHSPTLPRSAPACGRGRRILLALRCAVLVLHGLLPLVALV